MGRLLQSVPIDVVCNFVSLRWQENCSAEIILFNLCCSLRFSFEVSVYGKRIIELLNYITLFANSEKEPRIFSILTTLQLAFNGVEFGLS